MLYMRVKANNTMLKAKKISIGVFSQEMKQFGCVPITSPSKNVINPMQINGAPHDIGWYMEVLPLIKPDVTPLNVACASHIFQHKAAW